MPTTQEIINGSACIDCGVPQGYRLSALVYLFSEIAGVTDVQTILAGARCIDCGIPEGMRLSALIYLAGLISDGGSGGSFSPSCSASDPTDPPTGSCGMHINTATGAIFIWDGTQWVFKV